MSRPRLGNTTVVAALALTVFVACTKPSLDDLEYVRTGDGLFGAGPHTYRVQVRPDTANRSEALFTRTYFSDSLVDARTELYPAGSCEMFSPRKWRCENEDGHEAEMVDSVLTYRQWANAFVHTEEPKRP